ncbi:hypothetical protein PL321_14390 [Caloramator sp. mosi_1]|nr:hypothetical protein [Caloramator sp. mosi_1]WDC83729.1 hypothetical protein PL321_14390 [Caloramator sp. mosi_1]
MGSEEAGEVCEILIGGTPSRNNLEYWDINKKLRIYGYQLKI